MTLCVFTLIASEFLPVSLLTPIAKELGVSEGLAGYGIAISGAFAVLTSLSISTLAGTMNRKTLLLLLTALMGISGLVVGTATTYVTYMLGRALIGVVVGGFWSMSAAVAMRLVPPNNVSKALAIFNGGNALATVVAAPLGSYLGGTIGWRGAFFALLPLTLIALVWQWISLPSMKVAPRTTASANVFGLLKRPLVLTGMFAVGAFFMGQFVLFTYVRPFLETVTRVDFGTLSMVLLVIGVAGFVGTLVIGSLLKWSMYRTLIVIPLLMAVIASGLIAFGEWVPVVFVLLGLWGLMATAAPTGWWSWLAKALPQDAEAGGGLMVAVIQLCIALGSIIGGMLFDGSGYRVTFIVSSVLLLIAAVLAFKTSRINHSSN
ncbi:MFS transporter [Duganella sp. FT135W]|uniref:MFS transporter n=1 Tax=Duganella flavida TaxID=2692175 RepID=A0A6L8K5H6_9BURK|nr:MFS transporter [Duganella flavida]MYM22195.1 MFS transporter [Duganella flavida]